MEELQTRVEEELWEDVSGGGEEGEGVYCLVKLFPAVSEFLLH